MSKAGALDLASGLGGKMDKEDVLSAVDKYEKYHSDFGGVEEDRKANYTDMVNKYYDLVTSFYEYGWGESFHFAPRWKGESLRESIKRHEHFLALQLGLKPGQKVLDVGCGIGGPLREISRFSSTSVMGINNNEYQITRGKALNRVAGVDRTCDFTKADFMKMPFSDASFDAVYDPQETLTRPANSEGGTELLKDRAQVNVSEPEGTSHLHENGERLFTPFFWLRNKEDAEKPTQLTPLDPVNDSPLDGPCFSDIKDSEDDPSCYVTSKDVNMFDSEMFEWTQRPCSPELCASPMKIQEKESDDRVQVKTNVMCANENAKNLYVEQETDKLEVVLPALSPLQTKEADHEAKVKWSRKRTKKTEESIQKK